MKARSMVHLNKGDSASALRELNILIGFGRMMEESPLIIDQFITAATASRSTESLEFLICHSSWEPADLLQLHQHLQSLDLLDSMWRSFYLEKLFSFHWLLHFPHNKHDDMWLFRPGKRSVTQSNLRLISFQEVGAVVWINSRRCLIARRMRPSSKCLLVGCIRISVEFMPIGIGTSFRLMTPLENGSSPPSQRHVVTC